MICPHCHAEVDTTTKTSPSVVAWLSGFIICILGYVTFFLFHIVLVILKGLFYFAFLKWRLIDWWWHRPLSQYGQFISSPVLDTPNILYTKFINPSIPFYLHHTHLSEIIHHHCFGFSLPFQVQVLFAYQCQNAIFFHAYCSTSHYVSYFPPLQNFFFPHHAFIFHVHTGWSQGVKTQSVLPLTFQSVFSDIAVGTQFKHYIGYSSCKFAFSLESDVECWIMELAQCF